MSYQAMELLCKTAIRLLKLWIRYQALGWSAVRDDVISTE